MNGLLRALLIAVSFAYAIASSLGEPRPGQLGRTPGQNGCQCVDYNCGCCFQLDVPRLHLNDTGCVNVSYVKSDIGVDLTVTVDGRVIFHQEVSVRNPPALCAEIPHLENLAKLCLQLYNLTWQPGSLYGCLEVKVKVAEVVEQKLDLGCFSLPIPQSHITGRKGALTLGNGHDLTFDPKADLKADPKVGDIPWELLEKEALGARQGVEAMVMERLAKGLQAWKEKRDMKKNEGQSGQK